MINFYLISIKLMEICSSVMIGKDFSKSFKIGIVLIKVHDFDSSSTKILEDCFPFVFSELYVITKEGFVFCFN